MRARRVKTDTGRACVTTEADTGDWLWQPKGEKLPTNGQELERGKEDPRNFRGNSPADPSMSGF